MESKYFRKSLEFISIAPIFSSRFLGLELSYLRVQLKNNRNNIKRHIKYVLPYLKLILLIKEKWWLCSFALYSNLLI